MLRSLLLVGGAAVLVQAQTAKDVGGACGSDNSNDTCKANHGTCSDAANGKCQCAATEFVAVATDGCAALSGIATPQVCVNPSNAGDYGTLDSKYQCNGTHLFCAANNVMKADKTCVALSGIALGTEVLAGKSSANGSAADQMWDSDNLDSKTKITTADTKNYIDCADDHFLKAADTCATGTDMELGKACFIAANTTNAVKTLTDAGLQCVATTGTEGAGKIACAAGKVMAPSAKATCVAPTSGLSVDCSAAGTPSGAAGDAATTADKNTFALPTGYKCLTGDKLACDYAGDYALCDTECKKAADCTTAVKDAKLGLGKGCSADAQCAAGTCVGVGSTASCKCEGLATSATECAAAGTKVEKGASCKSAGSNLSAAYMCDDTNVQCVGVTETDKICTEFTGTLGGTCTAIPTALAGLDFACTDSKVACKTDKVQCTTNKMQCAAKADDTACKCAYGEIKHSDACTAMKVGVDCTDLTTAVSGGIDTDAHECKSSKVACKTGYEECAAGAKAGQCVLQKADPALCPPAATSTGGGDSSSSTSESAAHGVSAFLPVVVLTAIFASFA